MFHKIQTAIVLLIFIGGCSGVTYQARGEYMTEENKERELLLQWKAQKYYIPFMSNRIDYGSYSFQEECRKNILQDRVEGDQYGFAFKERPQNFTVVAGTPIKAGNHIICAKTKNDVPIGDIKAGDTILFQILCEARGGMPPITPANGEGYPLKVSESEGIQTLECRD